MTRRSAHLPLLLLAAVVCAGTELLYLWVGAVGDGLAPELFAVVVVGLAVSLAGLLAVALATATGRRFGWRWRSPPAVRCSPP